MSKICLSPYVFTSLDMEYHDGIFIDNNKTKQIVVTSDKTQNNPPCSDAILLYEVLGQNYNMRWYECPSQMGRTYIVRANACEVIISSFENGLGVIENCNGMEFGSSAYCFGKDFKGGTEKDIEVCSVRFDFDGHVFFADGKESDNPGIYNCSHCGKTEQHSDTNVVVQTLDNQSTIEPLGHILIMGSCCHPDGTCQETEQLNCINSEYIWTKNGTCNPNPCIVKLQEPEPPIPLPPQDEEIIIPCGPKESVSSSKIISGSTVSVYEKRHENGNTQIEMYRSLAPQELTIIYDRKLSKGRLLNNINTIPPNTAQFKVYDNILVDGIANMGIGFKSGPLKGKIFHVTSVSRSTDINGNSINLLTFVTTGTSITFPDSNDIFAEWYLYEESN